MKKILKKRLKSLILFMTVMSLSACNVSPQNNQGSQEGNAGSDVSSRVDTGYILTGPDSFDSADTSMVVAKNRNDNTVTFLNLQVGRRYTLSVDGTTHLYDKYGSSISLQQVEPGDIVDITFLRKEKHLTSMKLSAKAWKNESVENYEIDTVRNQVSIGSDIYKLSANTLYLSGGHVIGEMDLNPADILDFQGIDTQILSVRVAKGHGYLRLVNDENFVGGWIEVGKSKIQRIAEDMLLVVPEGSYQVNISHKGGGGTKSVIINRNEEVTLDIGDLEIPKPQTGMVLFSLNPPKAQLYIDGTETDASQPVVLEYGIHQLIVKAEGYKSITQYIRVGQASAGVNIVLETVGSESDKTESENKDVTDISSNYYKVHIDSPESVEVYLDGNYIGIAPCSFKKESGAHVITLRKTGYTTRSYTIQVDSDQKDISYSFADLTAVDGNSNTTSSNDILNAGELVNELINSVL